MARKGSSKVRTGCITCKIRKVKCDENKPSCRRCITTGRKCDGYVDRPVPGVGFPRFSAYVIPSSGLRPYASELEARALDYFHRIVASAITSNVDSSRLFWTHTVQQAGQQEPAVRHAITAISSLYERLGTANTAETDAFALQQYNRAIAKLVTATPDEAVLLLVCVLMICIELLLGNVQAAIDHCRHGVTILNRASALPSTRDLLLPVFCRLSTFPCFFRCSASTFPVLQGLDLPGHTFAHRPHLDTSLLRPTLEILISRSARLLQTSAESRRSGLSVTPTARNEQRLLDAALQHWLVAFQRFQSSRVLSPAEIVTCHALEVKHHLVTVWINCAFDADGSAYRRHTATFKTMTDIVSLMLNSLSTFGQHRPKFLFDMGFLPILYFVSLRCKCLHTRVRALRLMRSVSAYRESVWDADVAFSVARHIILFENGVDIAAFDPECEEVDMQQQPLEKRTILDIEMDPELDSPGWRGVSFLVRVDESVTVPQRERVPIIPAMLTAG